MNLLLKWAPLGVSMRRVFAGAGLALACLLGGAQALAQNAYITNQGSNNVSVIATASNTVTATIPVGHAPGGVSLAGTVTATIPVGQGCSGGVAVTPDGSRVYVANLDDNTCCSPWQSPTPSPPPKTLTSRGFCRQAASQ
jgi:YVTN family beta-propeller protein